MRELLILDSEWAGKARLFRDDKDHVPPDTRPPLPGSLIRHTRKVAEQWWPAETSLRFRRNVVGFFGPLPLRLNLASLPRAGRRNDDQRSGLGQLAVFRSKVEARRAWARLGEAV